tara:strand:- start:196 stop:753 length:558 start_codon:yes stop_codon:yes gene_type:complete
MWARISDGSIVQTITRPRSMIIGNVQYSSIIFTKAWSDEQRKELGIIPFTYIGNNINNIFYTSSESEPEIKEDSVVITHTKSSKDIDTIKASMLQSINETLSNALSSTDWIIIRKIDTGKEPPSDLVKWRTDCRAKAAELETLISAKNTVGELESLTIITKEEMDNGKKVSVFYDWPRNPKETIS